ncbi:MAG: hypothetical protein ACUVWX_06750, partial [Kiritimatiellia bacterium]
DADYRRKVLLPDGTGRQYLEQRVWTTIATNVEEIFERVKAAKKHGADATFREQAGELALQRLTDRKLRRTFWL